jgi:hypothetical protein
VPSTFANNQMLRRVATATATAALLAGCGGSNGLPKTPTTAAARSCLQRHGMSSELVPATKLRPITYASANASAPVAELSVIKPAPTGAQLLIAYFDTSAAATAAVSGVNPNASAFRGARHSLEIQQAAAGKRHGRVLVIEFNPRRATLKTLFVARFCTTGVPVPRGSPGARAG